MLWIKSIHIIFMVTWFAGLFYLPRLYVYHCVCTDEVGHQRFIVMERRLLAIMTIGASITVFFGMWLWLGYGFSGGWLHLKLLLVIALIGYHFWCWYSNKVFAKKENKHGEKYYRYMNEVPGLLLIAIVILVVVKPF